jgi:hypothetical protein
VEPIDSGVFAGELRPSQAGLAKSAKPPLVRQAIRTGAFAGALPGAIVFIAYFVSNHGLPLPWVTLGTQVMCIATAAGMVLAGSVQAMVLAFDQIARIHPVLVAIANPIVAGALAGAIGGVIPGAIGVSILGAYHGPFLGTVPIACALIGGTTILIVPLTLRARRARCPKATGDRWCVAAATAIATVIVLALAVVIAPIMVEIAFSRARGSAGSGFIVVEAKVPRATIGAIGGSIGGMVLGLYVGIAMAIGRALRCRASGSVR